MAKHPGGRPTKYRDEFNRELEKYLSMTGREQTSLPTVEGFSLYLGVSRDSLYEWAKKYPKFSDTLKKIEVRQKQQLVDDGVYGGKEVNATIVKLMLMNNHGMRERSSKELTGKDGKDLTFKWDAGDKDSV